jgi:uncharacterized protein (TIGR03437 family)
LCAGASYTSPAAAESIGTAFGADLATAAQAATSAGLPFALAGTTVSVTDSAGAVRQAPLFAVAPTQVSFQVPPAMAAGEAG